MGRKTNRREFDFTLVLAGFTELTTALEDAILKACDDATLAMRSGRPFLIFSREAPSMKEAVLSAIQDVRGIGMGVDVLRVDYCTLVTQAEIARKIGKSRQMVFQYIQGVRGPGAFPPPVCDLVEGQSLWNWSEVASWLWENNMVRESVLRDAEMVELVNVVLGYVHKAKSQGPLTREVKKAVETQKTA
jgi:predicted DNA-binding transcriptional regulator AlpA